MTPTFKLNQCNCSHHPCLYAFRGNRAHNWDVCFVMPEQRWRPSITGITVPCDTRSQSLLSWLPLNMALLGLFALVFHREDYCLARVYCLWELFELPGAQCVTEKTLCFQARACTLTSTALTRAPARVRARRHARRPASCAPAALGQSGALGEHERGPRGRARRGRFLKAGARTCASPRSLLCGGVRAAQIQ